MENVKRAVGLQKTSDLGEFPDRVHPECVDVEEKYFIEVLVGKTGVEKINIEDFHLSEHDSIRVRSHSRFNHFLGAVDRGQMSASKFFADQRDCVTVSAAYLENAIVGLNIEQFHRPDISLWNFAGHRLAAAPAEHI